MKSEILTQAVQLSDPQHHLFHGLNYMKLVTLVPQNIHRIFQIPQQKKYFLIYMPQSPTLQKTLLLILWQIIKEVGKSSLFLRNLKMMVEQTSLEKQKNSKAIIETLYTILRPLWLHRDGLIPRDPIKTLFEETIISSVQEKSDSVHWTRKWAASHTKGKVYT